MNEKLPVVIERARKALGYTQDQAASAIGVSRPTYAGIESGTKDLTVRQAETISAFLQISMNEILGAADSKSVGSTDKYKQIILNSLKYGADEDGKITKTKLAKLVYLADFVWYYLHLSPMSGMTYRKLPWGPVADIYFRALDELEEDGAINRETRGRAVLFSLVEKEAPISTKLSEQERTLIEKISSCWKSKSTDELVSFTCEQLPWQICREGEIIPYNLITQEEPRRVYGLVQLYKPIPPYSRSSSVL